MRPRYDKNLVRPMWKELEAVGVTPLTTADEVDSFLKEKEKSSLVVVNSVCGCAAGAARPAVAIALQNKKIPDQLGTVFAGVDMEAVARAREYFEDVPPTSPSIYLFSEGEVKFVLPRHEIEGRTAEEIANDLVGAFDQHCDREGPSVSRTEMMTAFGLQQVRNIASDS